MKGSASIPPGLLLLTVVILLTPRTDARAQEMELETTLPACGIRYPGGYDPNTVGAVEGRVAAFTRPERGPVSFQLEAAGETYTVFVAPAWYLEDQMIRIEKGDQVRVKGSKTMGADGNLYLVAQELTLPGTATPVILRDVLGKPSWSGRGGAGHGRRDR